MQCNKAGFGQIAGYLHLPFAICHLNCSAWRTINTMQSPVHYSVLKLNVQCTVQHFTVYYVLCTVHYTVQSSSLERSEVILAFFFQPVQLVQLTLLKQGLLGSNISK